MLLCETVPVNKITWRNKQFRFYMDTLFFIHVLNILIIYKNFILKHWIFVPSVAYYFLDSFNKFVNPKSSQ